MPRISGVGCFPVSDWPHLLCHIPVLWVEASGLMGLESGRRSFQPQSIAYSLCVFRFSEPLSSHLWNGNHSTHLAGSLWALETMLVQSPAPSRRSGNRSVIRWLMPLPRVEHWLGNDRGRNPCPCGANALDGELDNQIKRSDRWVRRKGCGLTSAGRADLLNRWSGSRNLRHRGSWPSRCPGEAVPAWRGRLAHHLWCFWPELSYMWSLSPTGWSLPLHFWALLTSRITLHKID